MGVNALSGLYLISTFNFYKIEMGMYECQCPLGLIPHFYADTKVSTEQTGCVSMPSRAYTSFLLPEALHLVGYWYMKCQCPLGLIPHFYTYVHWVYPRKDLMCQCPLGLIPHFYPLCTITGI